MRQLIAILAALAAAPALADDRAPDATTSDSSAGGDAGQMKGYGYGTPSGVESNGSAGQATKAEPSRAPQEETHADSARGGERGAGKLLHGKVAKVSREALSLRGEGGKVERLKVSARTTALRDGKPIAVEGLRAGEEVRASFEEGKGGRVATQITVVGAKD